MLWWLIVCLFGLLLPIMAHAQPSPPPPSKICVIPGTGIVPCDTPLAGITTHDHSGFLATGGSSQIAIPANPNRTYCSLQAQTTDLFINYSSNAPTSNLSKNLPVGSEDYCQKDYKGDVSISGLVQGAFYHAEEGTYP